jgi:hypothetical protein
VGCISLVHTFCTITLWTGACVARRPSTDFSRFVPVAGILHDIRPHLTAHPPVCANKLLMKNPATSFCRVSAEPAADFALSVHLAPSRPLPADPPSQFALASS